MKLTDKLSDYATYEDLPPCITLSSKTNELEESYGFAAGSDTIWIPEHMLFMTISEFLSYYSLGLFNYHGITSNRRVDKFVNHIKELIHDN